MVAVGTSCSVVFVLCTIMSLSLSGINAHIQYCWTAAVQQYGRMADTGRHSRWGPQQLLANGPLMALPQNWLWTITLYWSHCVAH